ncbi:MAG: DMT family transporter [Gammaproteobacteria bacterium]|nr:DMT family transporter [Gammaproteobacteria bacterium]
MILRANLMLVIVTLLWGLTFPFIKIAMAHVSPGAFVCARFALAALALLPIMLFDLYKSNHKLLLAGLVLGLFNSVIYLTQTIGLQTISAPRSAFITGINVLLVPFLLPLVRMGKLRKLDIGCALLSLLGLYVLTAAGAHTLSRGDLWTLLSAVLYAVAIIYIQWVTPKFKHYRLLTFYQIVFTLPLAAATAGSHFSGFLHRDVIISLLFCALGATALALYLQIKYQQYTRATQAALIYCLEPIFATIAAFFITGNTIALQTLLGGAIIFISLVLSTLFQ